MTASGTTSESVRVTFGVKTTPMRVGYEEILRVWEEADGCRR